MTFLLLFKIRLGRCPSIALKTRSAVDLAYKLHGDIGNEIPVVILHGLLGSKKNWESMSKKINASTRRAVIAADARNHGNSPHADSHRYHELASDVSQLIDKLSIKQAIIIGHSMGGRTGMVLALTEPSKVAALVVVDISPITNAGVLRSFFPNLLKAMQSIKFMQSDNIGMVRNEVKNNLVASNVIDADSIGFILMNIGIKSDKTIGWMNNINALNRHFGDIASFPSEMSGKVYSGKTLFIGGKESDYIPSGDIDGIRKYFPNVDLKYVPDAGHNVHADNPEGFLKLVLEFLSSIK